MKVSELYKGIDLSKMKEAAHEDTYGEKSYNFIVNVWNKPIESLSKKQVEWLEKIDEKFGK